MNNVFVRRLIILAVVLTIAFFGGKELWDIRHFKQSIVVSEDFTEKVMLSNYFDGIKGTWVDTPVYIYDSGNPGASMLWMGGTHPYEPATMVAAYVAAENIKISKGKIYLIPVANRSAWTMGDYGFGYPPYFTLEGEWGKKKFRIGARGTNQLDQFPDPFTYIHYPSRQNLAYEDIRNLNRTFPGYPTGSLTERLSFAFMELIRNEKIDLVIDMHEASLMYPVVSTFVSHQNADDIAMMAAMNLSAEQFPMKTETSPKGLRGLTHREIGDYSDALVVLMETAEPFIDRVASKLTEELMVEGKCEFLQTASEKGLLFCDPPYDIEFGEPMWYRVGRHLSSTMEVIKQMGFFFPDKEMHVEFPTYFDLEEHDIMYFLHNPETADPDRVFYQ